ncbi:hypothetical protein BGZ83_001420 [Gryganskiella cystojenkinii]|nr:hypothetical protein BGZ83_001420 [Gryganskiella cystojenkinii]
MSNADSAALRASLTQSRQTWTHSAFTRFNPQPGADSTSNKNSNSSNHGHSSLASEVSLTGVCTVSIGPHIFLDTKFFTVTNPITDTSTSDETFEVKSDSGPTTARQLHRPRHQVVLEFKENANTQWLFPDEASLEFFPANERDSAQISASFNLPLHDQTNRQGKPRAGADQDIAVDMTISHATAALWEGLELAVKGPRTINRTGVHRSQAVGHRSRTSSTYDEDPSEILGSGKKSTTQNRDSSPTKRKQDAVMDSFKTTKPKKLKQEQPEEKSPNKKAAVNNASPRKNGVSAPSTGPSSHQKHCGYCHCTSTPMWRRGPLGPSTLCNACGVKWKHGKIMQDVTETQDSKPQNAPSTASSSGSSTSHSAPRSSSSKVGKESANNSHGRPPEDQGGHNRTGSKKATASTGSSSHGSRRDSKISEPEKMVPVKKRHSVPSAPTGSLPNGPRMVPIHELDNREQPPALKKNGLTHLLDVASEELKSTLLASAAQAQAAAKLQQHQQQSASTVVVPAPIPNHSQEESSLALYPLRNTFTNNTATFPLHFPTISVGFGPNNASYNYPNCAVVLYENYFQIQLVQAGERTAIDVWKEGIEGTEFQVVDAGDGENMIVMKALSRQYLTRFDKELLNPDRNETLIVFRFRERLGGGGPPVKPLLEHWLATDIPVPPQPSSDGSGL